MIQIITAVQIMDIVIKILLNIVPERKKYKRGEYVHMKNRPKDQIGENCSY